MYIFDICWMYSVTSFCLSPSDHVWPSLDFGWTLADVFKKLLDEESSKKTTELDCSEPNRESVTAKTSSQDDSISDNDDNRASEKSNKKQHGEELEIGTWSNDMAFEKPDMPSDYEDDLDEDLDDMFDPNEALPDNLTILSSGDMPDEVEGELGADWGTGLKERKAKSSSGNINSSSGGEMRNRRSMKSTSSKAMTKFNNSNSKGSSGNSNTGEIFRVGSPSNFECDENYETNCGDMFQGSGDIHGGGGWSSGNPYGYDDSDAGDDYDDYWDDYDALSEAESTTESIKHNTSTEWNNVAKNKSKPADQDTATESLDVLIGEIDDEQLQKLEEEYQQIIEERKNQIVSNENFVTEDKPLVFEKARRPENTATTNGGAEPKREITPSLSQVALPNNRASIQWDEFGPHYKPIDCTSTLDSLMKSYVNKESTLYPVGEDRTLFSFDHQPNLSGHYGPSPSIILQALTMSNANDGVNLERLETIGDSYLKYAITTYLYCAFPQQHEGKLSYLRSKQVSNLNLYRLGKYKGLGECMVATKFEPHDNWLPPSYYVPRELEEALIASGIPSGHWNMADLPNLHDMSSEQIKDMVHERTKLIRKAKSDPLSDDNSSPSICTYIDTRNPEELPIFIPYNLLTQHSIPDKSIADSVEALIGAYLTTCGPKGALLFMSWLGIKVLPTITSTDSVTGEERITFVQVGTPPSPLHLPRLVCSKDLQYTKFTAANKPAGDLLESSATNDPDANHRLAASPPTLFASCPQFESPITLPDPHDDLKLLLKGYDEFERVIGYEFVDQSYLLQAFTHASFCRNRLTDCYQRLEFLGDAVLGKILYSVT